MNVLLTSASRFVLTPDGHTWTAAPQYQYSFWSRYLDVFDEVRLLSRARRLDAPPDGWGRASGPGVTAIPIPFYDSSAEYLIRLPGIRRAIRGAVRVSDAVILRLPCAIASETRGTLQPGRPYGVEVIGDPYDVLAPGAVRHPLRPLLRLILPGQVRRACAGAAAAAYVTAEALQRRYPPAPGAATTHFSSIVMSPEHILESPRTWSESQAAFSLITVGSLAQPYKGTDVLIDAVAQCCASGLDLRLTVVGGGRYLEGLQQRADGLGLGDRVRFAGQVSSADEVRAELDAADLFVLPSRTEGLPKAVVEAMARALPCIGTSVGGIPELLAPECLVPSEDVAALAARIRELLASPRRMAAESARNLAKASEFRDDVLRARRNEFYQYLRDKTGEWQRAQGAR